jgi:carboxylesterase type B
MKFHVLSTLLSISSVALTVAGEEKLGVYFQDGQPLLKLPYATYQGTIDPKYNTVTFQNIRFAAPPTGELRWAKPAPPPHQDGIQKVQTVAACSASEDCLFLDVTISKKVIEAPEGKNVPVLVWIHGGAYSTFGSFIIYERYSLS